MNKYLGIFKTSFKQESDAIFDTLFRCVMYTLFTYVLIELWSYIYGEGAQDLINGYTLVQMLWYLIIGECLVNTTKCAQITRDISNEIKSGSIAYKLNKPYNFYLYSISSFMAKTCFTALFTIPTAIVIGIIFAGIPATFTPVQILPCILVFIFSTFISWCLYGVIGLIAFWTQDSTPYYWVVSKTFLLLGTFFPIEFFPGWLQPIIRFSPIYSITSGPSGLVAAFSWSSFATILLSQIIWCSIILLIGICLFNLGRRRVTSNGG